MLGTILSEQKFEDKFVVDSLQEEAILLNSQIESLIQERADLSAKTLMLEQLNLDLTQKSIQ